MPERTPPPTDPVGDAEAPDLADVRAVFDLWVSLYRNAKRPPVLDNRRRSKIRKAIADYGKDTVEAAVRGLGQSDWHMGRNPQRKKYDDIELVLRDAKHVEMFADMWDSRDPDAAAINIMRSTGEDW